MYHVLFTHSSADGHLGPHYFLAFMNNDAMNIHVQESVVTCVFISLEHT